MKNIIFNTKDSYAPIALRLLLAIVIFPHGAQKLLGWFGGYGFTGTMGYFTEGEGLPWIVGFTVIIIEFFGPLFIVLGLATRIWSLGLAAVMTGVIITNFNQYFFMDWFGTQKQEGFEFFLLAIGMAGSLIISGSGSWSVDKYIARQRTSGRTQSQILQGVNLVS